ncbi:hypothetical protein Vadar_015702 [Vaccinium darrowii]|uniref:Uncharacterized protein n=1 Tax=Vaccinium darrowii TaxID=229202 RepID=A0ACB7XZ80_9ERIC|nr:hypothetical protein Vadar_015702 [Vaccinium darrowii]
MEDDSLPLSRTAAVIKTWNPCSAALSRPLFTSTDEQHDGPMTTPCIVTGANAIREMIRVARFKISHSLAYVAFYQGDEILALLPGTIIRSDGVVATCASHLRFSTTRELRVMVTVKAQNGPQHWIQAHEGALLDADLSSNLAFIKFTPGQQPNLAEFGKPSGCEGVAVGCISRGPRLDDTDFKYLPAYIGSMATTPGQDISANVQGDDSVIGGPLVQPRRGLVGVIHYANGRQIKATPIDEVLKCLERLEKREQDPKSIAKSFGDIDLEARPEIEPIHLDDENAFEDIFKDKNTRKQSACSSGTSSQPRAHCKRDRDTCDEESDIKAILDKLGQVADAITRLTWDRLDVQALHDEVMKMEGFDEAFLGSAFDYLVENERLGKAFMAKSINLRKIWLEKFSV